jgi:hypothetical protein
MPRRDRQRSRGKGGRRFRVLMDSVACIIPGDHQPASLGRASRQSVSENGGTVARSIHPGQNDPWISPGRVESLATPPPTLHRSVTMEEPAADGISMGHHELECKMTRHGLSRLP